MRTETPPLIRLEDYRPTDYLIETVDLEPAARDLELGARSEGIRGHVSSMTCAALRLTSARKRS